MMEVAKEGKDDVRRPEDPQLCHEVNTCLAFSQAVFLSSWRFPSTLLHACADWNLEGSRQANETCWR